VTTAVMAPRRLRGCFTAVREGTVKYPLTYRIELWRVRNS
jgi:hypothetical protein